MPRLPHEQAAAVQQDGAAAPAVAPVQSMQKPTARGLPSVQHHVPQLPQQPGGISPALAEAAAAALSAQHHHAGVLLPSALHSQQAPWSALTVPTACKELIQRQRRVQFIRQVRPAVRLLPGGGAPAWGLQAHGWSCSRDGALHHSRSARTLAARPALLPPIDRPARPAPQVVLALEQQAAELRMVVAGLEAAAADSEDSAAVLPLADLSLLDELGGTVPPDPLDAAAMGSLADVPAALLRAVAAATSAQPQRSIAAGVAMGRLHSGGLGAVPWAAAHAGGSGGAGDGAAPAAPALSSAAGPYQKRAHDPATCTAPNCRLCAYEQRLQQRAGHQQGAAPAQLPHPPFLQPAPPQPQPQPQQEAHATQGGADLGAHPSDAMAAALLEASGLLDGKAPPLVSGGVSAPLLESMLEHLPSIPSLLPPAPSPPPS